VQTFLPFPDFAATAQALDYRRLGKQRLEAKQIVTIVRQIRGYRNAEARLAHPRSKEDLWDPLPPKPKGWANHPAVLMWADEPTDIILLTYGLTMCQEWRSRGYVDNLGLWFAQALGSYGQSVINSTRQPRWMYEPKFHQSHQAALYAKDPVWYHYWKDIEMVRCCMLCNYYWPTHV
jgi:hypothetical protein